MKTIRQAMSKCVADIEKIESQLKTVIHEKKRLEEMLIVERKYLKDLEAI